MIPLFDCIVFRVFEYFNNKQSHYAKDNSVNFIVIFQATMLVPLFLFFSLFIEFDPHIFGDDDSVKYYIGIPLAIALLYYNGRVYKKKLNDERLEEMRKNYQKDKYKIPIWVIFIIPLIFIIVCPILYGVISGTLRFPLFEK